MTYVQSCDKNTRTIPEFCLIRIKQYHTVCDISFFSIWVFFHEHLRFTGHQGKGEAISLTPLYHLHPLHRHLDISRAITAESSPPHIASSRARTGNLWCSSASRKSLSYSPNIGCSLNENLSRL